MIAPAVVTGPRTKPPPDVVVEDAVGSMTNGRLIVVVLVAD